MNIRYLSVCSGIEAASVAWEPLGWQPAAFSEIDPFASAVLAHRFPGVPNYGDMTRFQEWPLDAVDLLVGGTPCQSFSVAGLRKGLADPRGNLALTYLAIADRYRPRWLVWENVPGVLSSGQGRDFGAFLGGLGQLGYGFAYRVLDAQYVRTRRHGCAVPQRRRRVFVVGHLGDWRPAAAVLLERESMSGHPPPRREAGEGTAVSPSLRAQGQSSHRLDSEVYVPVANSGDAAYCLTASAQQSLDAETETLIAVAHSLRAEGFDASEDGTGRGVPLVPVAFDCKGTQVQTNTDGGATLEGPHDTANIRAASGGSSRSYVAAPWAVRRLTPRECERLQGFPDNWTLVQWRKGEAPDGRRYKALGNSMAVNVMEWIGHRIALVDGMLCEGAAA